jgi:cytochrome P450
VFQNVDAISFWGLARPDSAGAACTDEEFVEAFASSTLGTGTRMALGPLRTFVKFEKARGLAHGYIDFHIGQALKEHSLSAGSDGDATKSKHKTLSQNLASQTDDIGYMRSQIIQAKLGTLETTAVLISNTVFLLARNAKYWQQLRSGVIERGDDLFTFNDLNSFGLLQNVLRECTFDATIYPIVNQNPDSTQLFASTQSSR